MNYSMSSSLNSLYERATTAIRRKNIGMVPTNKFARKDWRDRILQTGIADSGLQRFHIDRKTAAFIRDAADKLTEAEWLRVVQQTRLPFPRMWIEFDSDRLDTKVKNQTYGFMLQPGYHFEDKSQKGCFMSFWLAGDDHGGQAICGTSPSGFAFNEDRLSEVSNADDFFSGTDPATGIYALDTNLVSLPSGAVAALDKQTRRGKVDFRDEIESGSLVGVAIAGFVVAAFRREVFLFLWLLTARIIKQDSTITAKVLVKTKTRGTVTHEITTQFVALDILRVKEINTPRPELSAVGPKKAEHAVMGHYAVSKRGKKFWRKPHNRGKLPPKSERVYTPKAPSP